MLISQFDIEYGHLKISSLQKVALDNDSFNCDFNPQHRKCFNVKTGSVTQLNPCFKRLI